jgi:arylsulfatase A-like enzyme
MDLLIVGLAMAWAAMAAANDLHAQPPFNVVIIAADDLGWADLGCYGADLHETPYLDRLARNGLRFTNAYAASVCSPTRASLLTGKHCARLHMTIWREAAQHPPLDCKLIPPVAAANLPHSEVTLAEMFRSAGYVTALVGKWHLGGATHYPETHGFDVNVGGTLWGAPETYFYPYRGERRFGDEFRYVPHLGWGQQGEYLTDRLTDEALKVIDRAKDHPFFLYLAHHAPHTPIEAKPDLVDRYRRRLKPGLHHQNPKYAAMVHSLDESAGRLMERLASSGVAERTIIIFLSDNGGHVGQFDGLQVTNNYPLRSGKGSLYEGGIRVPMIIHWPGKGAAGRVCHEPVCVADLYPTLLDTAIQNSDQARNTHLDGQSLMPLLNDPNASLGRDALYFHYPHYYPTTTPVSAIRAGNWKLLEYHEDNHLELYDLGVDPGETKDLATSQPEAARVLQSQLAGWLNLVGAAMPTENPDFQQNL